MSEVARTGRPEEEEGGHARAALELRGLESLARGHTPGAPGAALVERRPNEDRNGAWSAAAFARRRLTLGCGGVSENLLTAYSASPRQEKPPHSHLCSGDPWLWSSS